MARKHQLTEAELHDLVERTLDLNMELSTLSDTIRSTLSLDSSRPIEAAKAFAGLAASAASASQAILILSAMAEDRAALEKKFDARSAE